MASHAGLAMLIGGVNVAYAQVANDGTTNYQTLKDAFDGAATGKTIKVLKDIEDFGAISFTNKTLTLNLDGHTVSGTSITVGAGAAFTIQTKTTPAVTVDAGYNVSYDAARYGKLSLTKWVEAVDGGQVTMSNGMVESTQNTAFFAFGDKTGKTSVSSKVTIKGGYVKAQEVCASPQGNGAEVIIEGGTNGVVLESLDNAVVAGNGTYTADEKLGGTTINIKGSKKNPCVLIGRIQTPGYVACGVYHPQQGKLTIGNYTKIVALGGAGVVMRGGELNLGGTTNIEVVATGDANLTGKVGDSRVVVGTSGIVFDRDCGYYDVANTKIKVSGTNTSVTGSHAAVQVINEKSQDVSNVISITGGNFSSDVSAFVDDDHDSYQKDDKYYVTRYVAQVGNEKYTSVLTAVNNAAAGATVQLLKNVSMGNAFSVSKQVTIDLNGKTLTIPYIEVNKDGNLTIKDGIAAQAGQEGGQLIGTSPNGSVYVRKGGIFTLESGTLTNNSTAEGTSNVVVWVEGDASTAVASTANIMGGKIVTKGTPVFARYNGATVNVSGGELEGHGLAAIAGNGSKGMGGTTINILGGTLTAYNAGGENDMACGVYHPQDGVLNITGGTIKAVDGVGVLMRSGQMKMTGGEITATGDANKSGTVGDSRVVVGRSGVVVDRDANYPVAENMSLTIDKDAKVSGAKAAVELLNANNVEDAKDAIHLLGGTFSSDVTAYCADGFMSTGNGDGTYGITEAKDAIFVGQDKNVYLAEGGAAYIDWLSLKKVVVANEVKGVTVNLSRNYANTGWNSFCVPFDITLTDEMLKTFEFAEVWDTELDQTTGGTTIEFNMCKAGDVLSAYYPYIIRVKEAGEKTLLVKDATLKMPTSEMTECSTLKQKFTFYGVLEQTYIAEKHGFYLRSSDNTLVYNKNEEAYIYPLTFYMTIQNKADDSYYTGNGTAESRRVAIRVIGENEATGISQVNMGASSSEEAVYNLQGVRMNGAVENLPKGVYIRNGHKFVVK